jgi:hypothetical protein
MNDILNEIKQDIQAERYQRLFLVHGKKLIIASAIIILALSVISIKRYYSDKNAMNAASLLMDQKYDEVIKTGNKTFSSIAALTKAGEQAKFDKVDDANKLLTEFSESGDRAFREKALLDKAINLINDKKDYKLAIEILDKISTKNSVFKFSALEVKASAYMQLGDIKKAQEIYNSIIADDDAPNTLKQRVKNVLSTIKEIL